jgi:hypothetical protein
MAVVAELAGRKVLLVVVTIFSFLSKIHGCLYPPNLRHYILSSSANASLRFCFARYEGTEMAFERLAGEFGWQRPIASGAFTWAARRISGRREQALVEVAGARFEPYRPVAADPLMWLKFSTLLDDASTQPAPEILDFASRYGRLTKGSETLAFWVEQVALFRNLWMLLQSIRSQDFSALIPEDDTPRPHGGTLLGDGQDESDLLFLLTLPGVEGVGQRTYAGGGNALKAAKLALVEELHRTGSDHVVPAIVADSQLMRPTLRLAPVDLLGAIMLQFSDVIAEDKQFQQCQVCGKWFFLSPEINRAHRLNCSNNCRIRAYRQRQAQARQLLTEGMTPKQIAKELDADLGTVKGWIKRGNEP